MITIAEELLLKSKDDLEIARRQEVEDRLSIYNDAWEDILKNAVNEQFNKKTRGNIQQMLAFDINVLKRIVNEVSVVYQESAKRSYIIGEDKDGVPKEDENYNELLKNMPINLTMESTNQLTNLNNESLIYIVPRNDTIEYDILTPDIVEVYQSPSDSKKVEAIVFSQSFVDTKGDTTLNYIYWDTSGNHLKFDREMNPIKTDGDGVNPYKDPDNPGQTILPFVIFHKKFPINTVWNVTSGGDIVSSTIQVAILLTYLNYLFKTQSFKQKYFTGVDIKDLPKELVNDPLWNIIIPSGDGKVGVLDYQVLLDKLWEIIYAKIGAVANNYGMSLDNFKIIGTAQSGYALKIKNLPLEKIVAQQIKLYRWHENELFEKTKIINNNQYPKKIIAEDGVFKIDFAEPIYPESPEDTRKKWSFDIKMGAKSIADYAQSVNPDLKSEEEAITLIEKNAGINKKIETRTGLDITELLNKAFSDEGSQQQ